MRALVLCTRKITHININKITQIMHIEYYVYVVNCTVDDTSLEPIISALQFFSFEIFL